MSKKLEESIIKLRKQNKGYKAIARELGLSRDQVRRRCIKHGLAGTRGPRNETTIKERERVFKKTFNKMFPDFEYHSGFVNVDSPLNIRCLKCGSVLQRNGQCIRNGRDVTCDVCLGTGKDVSDRVRSKISRRREILKLNGEVDYNITLDALVERDRNICYICEQECDRDDYHIDTAGNFIVGGQYPSIDHIIPVSRGGTHTWDNVQLAHHYCNSVKSDNVYTSIKDMGSLV